MKCRTKREIQSPQPTFNTAGAAVTRGTCAECGAALYRVGKTPAHEGMTPPPKAYAQHLLGREKGASRSGKLVIVESPAKARTVGRFLGKGYTVRASVGHVRDLLRSQLSVDVENNFAPKYRVPNEKKPVVKELKQLAKGAAEIYLATDPDREGEAIAWHLIEAAAIDHKLAHRVVFHEITEGAINEAFSHPRDINMDLVNAQQARRVLDRLVGYSISPILWEKVRSRLSAGRVQSVALRLIVDREREIEAFVSNEYWSIEAELARSGDGARQQPFLARLVKVGDQDVGSGAGALLKSEADVKPILADLERATYTVAKYKEGERRRSPLAPFTTSTLQREASQRLGYTAKRTMAVAQQLYEGLDVGQGGAVGLITYMRTDSTNVAEVAQKEAREYVQGKYGGEYLPPAPPQYKTRAKGAQEAHEAIRPTSVGREPKAIKESLSSDQFKLYNLIWQRFVASQMAAAIYDTASADIFANYDDRAYLLRAASETVQFPGFLVVYEETKEEDAAPDEEGEGRRLPPLADGDPLDLIRLKPEQHFTQPPPRFTEATLVKALEKHGIGRPSTYAPILSTIQARGYVIRQDKRLFPTETGILVNDLMLQYFPEIVDLQFTAHMEEDLDKIAAGRVKWVKVMQEFYAPFEVKVKRAQAEMPVTKTGPEPIGRACPECGKELVIRYGRYGKFISCSGFPECRQTEPWLEKIGVTCLKDGGDVVERKTRKGRIFYGCANYPNCDFTSWKRPLPKPCPTCQGMLVIANRVGAAHRVGAARKREAQCLNCQETFLMEDVVPENA